MTYLNTEIERQMKKGGASFIYFLDISNLPKKQNRHLPTGIFMGLAINPEYIQMVFDTPDYVPSAGDEYVKTEARAGELADDLTKFLTDSGYKALSQSDGGLYVEKALNFDTEEALLPHKTIATMSGAGWIGKNTLFITPQYGAAQSLATVLTDAPLETIVAEMLLPRCGTCGACQDACAGKLLTGKIWNPKVSRNDMVRDVYTCTTCLQCLVHCPWTMNYVRGNVSHGTF